MSSVGHFCLAHGVRFLPRQLDESVDKTGARDALGPRNTCTNDLNCCHACVRNCRLGKAGHGFLVCRATNGYLGPAAVAEDHLQTQNMVDHWLASIAAYLFSTPSPE